MAPLGGAWSTGVDQRMVCSGCAATEESAVCCGLPACVRQSACADAARASHIAVAANAFTPVPA